jgi:hypothetical protein
VSPRRLHGSLWQLSKENKFFSWALLAGALLRLDAMLGYPGALWFAGDSYVYVGAALRPIAESTHTTSWHVRAPLDFGL